MRARCMERLGVALFPGQRLVRAEVFARAFPADAVMTLHRRLESRPVNRDVALGEYLRRQVRWEATFRVQPEELLARNRPSRIWRHAIQQAQPGGQHMLETALFLGEQCRDMWRA